MMQIRDFSEPQFHDQKLQWDQEFHTGDDDLQNDVMLTAAVGSAETVRARIFLLSPANTSGIKGQRLLDPSGQCELAVRLRDSGAPLGEVYRYISSLYFRGKLDYAEKFKNPPDGVAGIYIITGAGLMLPETVVTFNDLHRISSTAIDAKNLEYRRPLESDLLRLRKTAGDETEVILLGSIATPKYIAPIRQIFGPRLLYPSNFLGLGDMSRGSILLRCCSQGSELAYSRVEGIVGSVSRDQI